MSTTDKTKLDGVAENANNYALPTNNVTNASVSGSTLTLSRQGTTDVTFTDTDTTYTTFTSTVDGLVPAPEGLVFGGGASGTTKFLREDGTWVVPTDTNDNTITSVGISGSETSGTVTFAGAGTVSITQSGSTVTVTGSAASTQVTVTEDRTNSGTFYPVFASGSTGTKDLKFDDTSTNGLSYVPSSSTLKATNFSGNASSANYADLAEIYSSDADYQPGTVLMFGGEQEVTIANEYGTTRVAGVVSEFPAYCMNSNAEGVVVALQGRVPVKVYGPVRKGDLMVASKYKEGFAEAGPFIGGAVIGKALENKDTDGEGVIEVVVGRV
jgi:hypothetical protein